MEHGGYIECCSRWRGRDRSTGLGYALRLVRYVLGMRFGTEQHTAGCWLSLMLAAGRQPCRRRVGQEDWHTAMGVVCSKVFQPMVMRLLSSFFCSRLGTAAARGVAVQRGAGAGAGHGTAVSAVSTAASCQHSSRAEGHRVCSPLNQQCRLRGAFKKPLQGSARPSRKQAKAQQGQ